MVGGVDVWTTALMTSVPDPAAATVPDAAPADVAANVSCWPDVAVGETVVPLIVALLNVTPSGKVLISVALVMLACPVLANGIVYCNVPPGATNSLSTRASRTGEGGGATQNYSGSGCRSRHIGSTRRLLDVPGIPRANGGRTSAFPTLRC